MLDLILTVAICWLFFKAIGLLFKAAWGVAKIIASILFAIAVPVLAVCLLCAGGVLLIVPLVLILIALGLLKAAG